MRFIYISVKNSVNDLPDTLKAMGHEVDLLSGFVFDPDSRDERALEALRERVKKRDCDYLISYLFIEEASDICERYSLIYISWIYDSPQTTLFSRSALNDVNRIFVFDRKECERLRSLGNSHVYYMPMAACTNRISRLVIEPGDEQLYGCDVSFVGDLYEDNPLDRIMWAIPALELEKIKKTIGEELCRYEKPKRWVAVEPSLLELCQKKGFFKENKAHGLAPEIFLGVALIARKQAQLERIAVLEALAAGEGRDVRLYTRSVTRPPEGVDVRGGVDYYTGMSKVFSFSRINLNITIPSIETGLPQRIWDIMGSGGFCLTNHQEEIADFFEVGREIETFRSLGELVAKRDFYLKHEDLRLSILVNGYRKVMACHTYEHRINSMLEIVGKS